MEGNKQHTLSSGISIHTQDLEILCLFAIKCFKKEYIKLICKPWRKMIACLGLEGPASKYCILIPVFRSTMCSSKRKSSIFYFYSNKIESCRKKLRYYTGWRMGQLSFRSIERIEVFLIQQVSYSNANSHSRKSSQEIRSILRCPSSSSTTSANQRRIREFTAS